MRVPFADVCSLELKEELEFEWLQREDNLCRALKLLEKHYKDSPCYLPDIQYLAEEGSLLDQIAHK
jgi:hypothetical protein